MLCRGVAMCTVASLLRDPLCSNYAYKHGRSLEPSTSNNLLHRLLINTPLALVPRAKIQGETTRVQPLTFSLICSLPVALLFQAMQNRHYRDQRTWLRTVHSARTSLTLNHPCIHCVLWVMLLGLHLMIMLKNCL